MVHRILQEELTNKKHSYNSDLNNICKRISRIERKAIAAERESIKYFQSLFVADKIGECFDGVVSGIADFGLFIKMNNNFCEGLVPMIKIPGDIFNFNAEKFSIIGKKTGREYNFGDRVKVRISDVSTHKRQIDLELIKPV
jgi:exoribonuclease R